MKKFNIVIADAALSLVPEKWLSDPKISGYKKKHKRLPLVDASDHQHLLDKIPREERLDRPDILHFGLLTLLGYQQLNPDKFDIYFTCKYGKYKVAGGTRLPRSQKRFYGILENLFQGKLSPFIMSGSIDLNRPSIVFSSDIQAGVSTEITTKYVKLEDFEQFNKIENLEKLENIVFGGFAVGEYRTKFENAQYYSLHEKPMELWTALSMFVSRFLM